MASLLGKADSTLAGMSYREAMADVMPDYSDIYKQKADEFTGNLALFQRGVGEYFDNLYADNNALADELKEAVSTTMADLAIGANPDDESLEVFNGYLNGLRQELKNVPPGRKGDIERAKIRAKMERLSNSTSGMDETLIDLGVRIENGDFDTQATGGDNLRILTAINDKTAKREIIDGELVYSVPGLDKKLTQQDLKKLLVSNDPEVNKAVHDVTVKAGALGKTWGMEWEDNRQEIVNGYRNSLSTKAGLGNSMHTAQGGLKYSFAEYLSGKGDPKYNMEIWSALGEAGVDVPEDNNGDGVINELDFTTPENGIAMIEQLTQISHNDFDMATTKNIVSEFLADNVGKKEFDDNRRVLNRPEDKKGGSGGSGGSGGKGGKRKYADRHYGPKGSTVEGNVLENIYQKFDDGAITMEDGSTWNRDLKTNIWTNDKTNETLSGDDMIGLAQNSAGGYSLSDDYLFSQFEGTEGSSGGGNGGGGGAAPVSDDEIDSIVKNIWEPDEVEGFGEDANGAALMSYLEKNHSGLLDGVEVRSDGEYIYFKRDGEKEKRWGGDSTGGSGYDRDDIVEVFDYLQSNETNTGGQVQTSNTSNTTTSTTFDPNENLGEESTTTIPPAQTTGGNNQQTTGGNTQQAPPTWRSNKNINAASVDQFNIKGSAGEGKANIFKNNKPINVKVGGGIATVTGVRADGDKLVVDVEVPWPMASQGGEKTMGEFSKSGSGFKFTPNKEIYGQLKGQDKKDFDAFVLAIETDPAFAMEIMKSVNGESDFNPADYK